MDDTTYLPPEKWLMIIRATGITPYLPPEIWLMIISYFDDQSSLSTLCQISKASHEIGTPLLYESPDFTAVTGYTTDDAFRTLVESPHLAEQVTKLREGFDRFAVEWENLYQAVETTFTRHIRALIQVSLANILPMRQDRIAIAKLLRAVGNQEMSVPENFCRLVLVSLLPNLSEMRLLDTTDLHLVGLWPDTLTKLTKVVITEKNAFEYRELKSLSETATNLDSLSVLCAGFHFPRPPWQNLEIPMFPSVTNLNLEGCYFYDLDTAATPLIHRLPALRSFRFYANGELGIRWPGIPVERKVENLLQALRHHAPQLKHFCLGDACDGARMSENTPEYETAWSRILEIIASFTSLETLSIDHRSLWPFDPTGRHSTSVLLDCLPRSIVHLHLEELGNGRGTTEEHYVLAHIKACICRLAQAISEDAKFQCLKLVSFSSTHKDEDLSEALEAMEGAGFPMLRQDCPWSRGNDWLYEGN